MTPVPVASPETTAEQKREKYSQTRRLKEETLVLGDSLDAEMTPAPCPPMPGQAEETPQVEVEAKQHFDHPGETPYVPPEVPRVPPGENPFGDPTDEIDENPLEDPCDSLLHAFLFICNMYRKAIMSVWGCGYVHGLVSDPRRMNGTISLMGWRRPFCAGQPRCKQRG